ncbi:MAG: MarR family winged helix-turn-helix transcriptional regulator [Phycisphaerales bacterium]|jgi:DNA-binding MarR family transcriptional regulator|nr:MarR family transcriptional regulator [Phycisphaeraceae bacterium]
MSVADRIPCLCAALRRASRAVTRLYDEQMQVSGLSSTQYTLLSVLSAAGPMPQHELADILAADPTTLSRVLATMHGRAWIRPHAGDDRRVKLWGIAPAGRRTLEKAEPGWKAAQERMARLLGEPAFAEVRASLLRVGTVAAEDL